ncbi:hypothetical protein GCM10023165_52860 [Variovorax defluvii]|uniref:Uncharacterized protein n=1 Tax=Variovorax defluvii TaxID=913761 RepID=A0ABP8IG38_9BURK
MAPYTPSMSTRLPERYCGYCAASLIPLEVPHTSADCATCGKRRHEVRHGEGGKGIKIEAGETFTIPQGWPTISFDPKKANGQLSRYGVPFLLQQFFLSWAPPNSEELIAKVEAAFENWQTELQASDKLAGIDLQASGGAEQAWERLKDDRESWEFHMFSKCVSAVLTQEAVRTNDAQAAAHAALFMGLQHGLSIVAEPYLEETIWRGYQAGLAIHESSAAADHVPGEVEALAELDPLFRQVGEPTLRTWLDSGATLGPRLGITKLPESLLVARAKWHVEEFKREREERAKFPAERRAWWDLTLKWLTLVGAVLSSAAFAAVWTYLNRG